MNNYIQKVVEDFDFNNIQNDIDTGSSFAENALGLVDLVLPSGTLWCKCNLGANTEIECGDYYAWGELNTKDEYTKENYTYEGRPIKLFAGRDVATRTLGENYSIPTKKQFEELLKYTDNKWVENYKSTGVNGQLFVSKINGNSIFIPAAGTWLDNSLNYNGSCGRVWSSSFNVNSFNYAWLLRFDNDCAGMFYGNRYSGQSIRPVFKKINL